MTTPIQLEPGSRVKFIPVTIPAAVNGLSAPVALYGYMIKGVIMPAAWTAAGLTFQANKVFQDDGGYENVVDSGGTEVNLTVAASRYVTLNTTHHELMSPLLFIKVRSGTSGAPVQQAAARDLLLVAAMSTE